MLSDRRKLTSSIEAEGFARGLTPGPDRKPRSSTEGLAARWSFPSNVIFPPLVEKDDVGPLPNEFVGLMPKVKAPPELEGLSLKVPLDAVNCKSPKPLLSSRMLAAPPNDVDCKAESNGPPTLKNPAVSPRLSND